MSGAADGRLEARCQAGRRVGQRARRLAQHPCLADVLNVMRAILALGLCGLMVALGVRDAHADPILVTRSFALAGDQGELALDGRGALIGTQPGDRALRAGDVGTVRLFQPGKPPTVVGRVAFTPTNSEFGGSMSFAASPSRIVLLGSGVSSFKGVVDTWHEALLSGPLGGPLQTQGIASECPLPEVPRRTFGEERGPVNHVAVAVSGEVVAYDSFDCVIAHDFGSDMQRVISAERYTGLPGWGTILRVSGRLLAYRASAASPRGLSSVVIDDIDSGQELYRTQLPADYRIGGQLLGPTFDIQSDGTLVVADARTCTALVTRITQATTRPLGVRACAVRRVTSGRALLVVPGPQHHRMLAWTPLQAPRAHVIADLGPSGVLEPALADMDEKTVLYALSGCQAPSIYRASLLQAGTPPSPPSRCPVRIARRATLTPNGLFVRIACPLGCEGNADATAGTLRDRRHGKGGYVGPDGLPHFSLAPGRSENLQLVEVPEELDPFIHDGAGLVRLGFEVAAPPSSSPMLFGDEHGETARSLGVRSTTSETVIVPVTDSRPARTH